MDKSGAGVLEPIGVMRKALSRWFQKLFPLIILYAVNIVLAILLALSKGSITAMFPDVLPWYMNALIILEVLVVIASSAYVCLTILFYLKKVAQEEQAISFFSVFREARATIMYYLKALVLLFLFVFVLLAIASLVWTVGRAFYAGQAAQGIRMAVLLVTSTVFVVIAIATAWYGFFFSIAPLIATFEKKGVILSFKESRARIRGNALRLVAVFLMYAALYVAVGLALVFVIVKLGQNNRQLLNIVDPLMSVFFGPLWLSVWFVSYKKLTEIKTVQV